jgi:hypothetical protein
MPLTNNPMASAGIYSKRKHARLELNTLKAGYALLRIISPSNVNAIVEQINSRLGIVYKKTTARVNKAKLQRIARMRAKHAARI